MGKFIGVAVRGGIERFAIIDPKPETAGFFTQDGDYIIVPWDVFDKVQAMRTKMQEAYDKKLERRKGK